MRRRTGTRGRRRFVPRHWHPSTGEKPNGEPQKDERGRNGTDLSWEGFKDYVKKMAAIPKEELDEKLAEEKREKKEKRAG